MLGDHFIDYDGQHLLSPECVSEKGVALWVQERKVELDEVLQKAREKFGDSR